METKDYLKYIVDEIHTVIVATVDNSGLPVTAAIDMMDSDDSSLYFLTAKVKNFYNRLKEKEFLAFTAMKGESTLSSIAVSVRGKVREVGREKISALFAKNQYMYHIYPTEESRQVLTVFQIYDGSGEYFDLSCQPIIRESFCFGEEKQEPSGYLITELCTGCNKCLKVCPQKCIADDSNPYKIQQNHCLHCGNCLAVCPAGAVERR